MIKEKRFRNDKLINLSLKCKSSIDHLNEFIIEKKLDKSDVINVVWVNRKDSTGQMLSELVLFYWDKE